jgi:nucleotide-binding universal stress UspA family protein
MKKILAAFDGLKYSQSTVEYAIYITRQINAHLVGVFLDDFTRHSYKIYDLMNVEGGVAESTMRTLDNEDKELRETATSQFRHLCHEAGIEFSIHHDRNIAIHELLEESNFADLLIIDAKETITHFSEDPPTRFIRDLLAHVKCPVLLVPPKFEAIGKNVLLYDGEVNSVFAIKSFSYLLEPLTRLQTELITVKSKDYSRALPNNRLMREYMKYHFPEIQYTVLKGLADIEIIDHLQNKHGNELIVLGAYSRGTLSRWLKPSVADALMREIKSPIFITEN